MTPTDLFLTMVSLDGVMWRKVSARSREILNRSYPELISGHPTARIPRSRPTSIRVLDAFEMTMHLNFQHALFSLRITSTPTFSRGFHWIVVVSESTEILGLTVTPARTGSPTTLNRSLSEILHSLKKFGPNGSQDEIEFYSR